MASLPATTPVGRPDPQAAGAVVGRLFEEHGKMVYGLCRLLMRNPVEAEDAAQEAFLSAHRALLAGHDVRDPAAWLATIARNECRARIRERMAQPLELVEHDGASGDDAADVASRRAEIEALCGALSELPPQQRDALLLREFYGLSYHEAATALGVSLAALESLVHRGRRQLQTTIRPARVAQGAITIPLSLHDTLAHALPGFAASGAPGGGIGIATAVSKVASAPLAAKLAAATATATIAIGAGATGVAAVERGPVAEPRQEPRVLAAAAPAPRPAHEDVAALRFSLASAGEEHESDPRTKNRPKDEDEDATGAPVPPAEEHDVEDAEPEERGDGDGDRDEVDAEEERDDVEVEEDDLDEPEADGAESDADEPESDADEPEPEPASDD